MPLSTDPLLDRLAPFRRLARNRPLGYGVAFLSVGVAAAARAALGDVLAIGTFVTFYPAVVAATAVGRFWPGILAAGLSILAADYFFIPPQDALSATSGAFAGLLIFAFNLGLIVLAISLLHEAAERLWRQEDKLRFVLESQPSGIIAVDDAGTITLVNGAIEKQFGYARRDLLGQKIDVLLPEQSRALHAQHRDKYMAHPEPRLMGAGRDLFGLRRDGAQIPVEIGLNPIRHGGKSGALATVLDISERKAAERRQAVLTNEVQHRARNLLTVVQVLANRALNSSRPIAEARQSFIATLAAMARTQELFAGNGTASLKEIVALETDLFGGQVAATGSDVWLQNRPAQDLSLVIHELCTNACKHGALRRPEGAVAIDWQQDGEELLFSWTESKGPPVIAPHRRGFGQTILLDLPKTYATEVSAEYLPEGLRYRLRLRWPAVAAPAPLSAIA